MDKILEEAVRDAYRAYVTFIEGSESGSVPVIDAVRAALTAALPFLPVQVAMNIDAIVQPLEDIHAPGGLCHWTDVATAIGEVRRALSALEPSAARELALEESFRKGLEAACEVIDAHGEYDQQLCCDGRECCCYGATVHQSMQHYIRSLSSPDHADAGKVEGDGWLPIESAPRDRTSVIIAVPAKEKEDGFIVGEAYFDPVNYEGGDWWWAGSSHTDHFDSPISELNYNVPTHWRPLPSAPASEGAE